MGNPYEHNGRLASEDVVVQAPMSFTGSAKRIWKITRSDTPALRYALLIPLALTMITFAWMVVLVWSIAFGLWLVPYRVMRRGDRNRKRQALQHRETLTQLEKAQQVTMMASLASTVATPVIAIGTIGPDGRYWWDGRTWQPMTAPAVAAPATPLTIEGSR